MDIKDFTKQFRTHPVLFIGTGISLRYYEKSYSWKELLKRVMMDLDGNDERLLNIDSRYDGNNLKIASEIESIFNRQLEEDRNGKFCRINDTFFAEKRKGNDYSRFKIYLLEILSRTNWLKIFRRS